ncbi:hypothetical protein [Usitatibacter palustris]|uniref:Uncharacterized protein n=1 Tax=Usitatibacter palustris TaxID=2732487 RepID=A0A6M4HAS5_9PROT|nr:hypothetical protein [Usitatibacter palustris]QJR15948.1 hypothetical protein DSM104440_02775 [Usitatibacter palustris]
MALLADILQLMGKAIASGVAVGIAAALVVLGLATTAQAAEPLDRMHAVNATGERPKPGSMAPTLPPIEGGPSSVGALWATHPQDGESTLQVLLGVFALAAAGMVAVIGRTVPAGGSRS